MDNNNNFVSPDVTKEKIIEKYFKKKDIFGNRKCIINFGDTLKYRINTKDQLGFTTHTKWHKASWKELSKSLNYLNENKIREQEILKKENDVRNFNWNFPELK